MISYSASRPNYAPPRFEPRPDMDLLAEIRIFLVKNHHMTEGKFGCLSCGNYYIVRGIAAGARLMPKTEKSIRDFMHRYTAPVIAVDATEKLRELEAAVLPPKHRRVA